MSEPILPKPIRIVLTGGPGGGKTTAVDLFRREIGSKVVVVPESATMLFTGGFPRHNDEQSVCLAQRAIYNVQRSLEDIQACQYPDRVLLCDRGTVDGAAYWPENLGGFFEHLGSSLSEELKRYDAVLFFETAASGGISIEGGNPARNETLARAIELDRKLQSLWRQHPRFVFVPHQRSFIQKITSGLNSLQQLFNDLLIQNNHHHTHTTS